MAARGVTLERAARPRQFFHRRRRRSRRDLLFILALFYGVIALMWAIVWMV